MSFNILENSNWIISWKKGMKKFSYYSMFTKKKELVRVFFYKNLNISLFPIFILLVITL